MNRKFLQIFCSALSLPSCPLSRSLSLAAVRAGDAEIHVASLMAPPHGAKWDRGKRANFFFYAYKKAISKHPSPQRDAEAFPPTHTQHAHPLLPMVSLPLYLCVLYAASHFPTLQ